MVRRNDYLERPLPACLAGEEGWVVNREAGKTDSCQPPEIDRNRRARKRFNLIYLPHKAAGVLDSLLSRTNLSTSFTCQTSWQGSHQLKDKPAHSHTPILLSLFLFASATSLSAESWLERGKRLNSRKLTREEAKDLDKKDVRDTRNRLHIRRIKPADKTVDWNTDPTAIPALLYQIHKRTGLPVHMDNEGLDVSKDEIYENLVIYLTAHHSWSFNEKETENLSKWLKRGGTLLLDDCYNKGSPFADSVGPEVGKMIPSSAPIMLLKTDKRVKDCFKMIYPMIDWPGERLEAGRTWQYFVLDERPAVFFSPNDDGCGWEISTPPTASNPIGEGIGHGGDNQKREQFYQWLANWMMFVHTH